MTTTSASRPINSTETTFSYAAAASGKNTATPNKSQTNGSPKPSVPSSTVPSPAQRPVSSASSTAAPNMNGSTAPTTRTSTPQSLTATVADSHSKVNGDTSSTAAILSSSIGSASTSTLPQEDDLVISMPEDKTASWEKQSQASSREDKKTSSAGTRTPEVLKDITLVPAPLPPVNPWNVRRDISAKKTYATSIIPPTVAKRPVSPSNTTVKDNVDKLVEVKQVEKKKQIGEGLDISEKETPKEGSSGVGKDVLAREPRDRKKSTDAGRINGYAGKDDAAVSRKSTRKAQQQPEKEPAPVLPPPVSDVESWPTPEIAQDEVEKAKREKDEKDKTASSGVRPGQKWVPVPITTPYVPPILGKLGRGGRGGRGGREGGSRGGSTAIPSSSSSLPNGEKHTGSGSSTGAENDRGRQGSVAGPSRGAYQGNKNGKNATTTSGVMQRRESKGSLPIHAQEKRVEPTSPEAGAAAPESIQSAKTSSTGTQTQTHTEKLRRGSRTDEPGFAPQGDARQFPETQDRGHQSGNGQGYHPRERGSYQGFNGNRSDHHGIGGDGNSTHVPRERGYEGGRGRGGYRGRGNHNSQFSNGHNNAGHHSNQNYTSTPHHFNSHTPNGQYPPQSSGSSQRAFRGSRSHPSHNNQGYNRYLNPNMPPPPPPSAPPAAFIPAYSVPFDAYMVAPNGMVGVHGEGPNIIEIITQINYYFSVDNLCKDMFLRKNMDSDGFVRLSVIAKFNRMKTLTQDLNLLGQACLQSQDVQLATGIDDLYIRKAVGWETWVLSETERDSAARCGMNDWNMDPRQRGQQGSMPTPQLEMSGSAIPFMPDSDRGRTQGGITPGAPDFVPLGTQLVVSSSAGVAAPLSADVPEFSPSAVPFINGSEDDHSVPKDEFPDHDIGRLVVVCKRNSVGGESSNTSPLASPSKPRSNGVLINGNSSAPSSPNTPSFRHQSSDIGWLLSGEVGHHEQSQSHLYVHKLYQAVLLQGLAQRTASGPSRTGEMVTLYKFWTHFLLDKFNGTIYGDLKTCALADADASVRIGLEYLFRFYEDLLKEREQIHDSLIQDFVDLAKKDARNGNELGAEKLASVLKSSRLSSQNKQKIEALLDSVVLKASNNGVEKGGKPIEPYST